MSKIKIWVEAMRLRTLPVSVAGVVAAFGVAAGQNFFKWPQAMLCLFFALLCQTASNFANEYYDYKAGRDRAGREGPRRGVTEGEISPAAMKYATFGLLATAAATGLCLTYWGGLWLIGIGALIFMGALAYSTGPWPLSTHCLGEVAVVAFFGLVPVNLTCYVMSQSWSTEALLTSISIGLMGANVLVVNNMRDIPDDIAVGKHTLATTFGRTGSLIIYIVNALAASALMFTTWNNLDSVWLVVPATYFIASIIIAKAMSRHYGRPLTRFLGITAMLMCLYSILFLIANIISCA